MNEHLGQRIGFSTKALPFKNAVLVNLLDGTIHQVPKGGIVLRDGRMHFTNLSTNDSPLVIVDRSWFQLLPNP